MAEYFIQTDTLTNIADAVRKKTQTTSKIKVSSLADKIKEITMVNEVLVEGDDFIGFIDGTVESIDNSTIESIPMYVLSECSSLKKANLPAITNISAYAFYKCSNLNDINFPLAATIGSYGFCLCSNLTEVIFPLVTTINQQAFEGCTALSKIDLPKATSISTFAFLKCSALETLILRSETLCTLGGGSLQETPIATGTGYIYVPSSLIESYKTATNWSAYANQFRAIEDYPDICGSNEEVSE